MVSESSKLVIEAMFIVVSNPKIGIAIINDRTINPKKHTKITNAENISCEKGFMSRNAVKAIIKKLIFGKDNYLSVSFT